MYGYLVLAARQNCTRQRFSEFMEDSLRAAKGLIKLGYDLRDEPLKGDVKLEWRPGTVRVNDEVARVSVEVVAVIEGRTKTIGTAEEVWVLREGEWWIKPENTERPCDFSPANATPAATSTPPPVYTPIPDSPEALFHHARVSMAAIHSFQIEAKVAGRGIVTERTVTATISGDRLDIKVTALIISPPEEDKFHIRFVPPYAYVGSEFVGLMFSEFRFGPYTPASWVRFDTRELPFFWEFPPILTVVHRNIAVPVLLDPAIPLSLFRVEDLRYDRVEGEEARHLLVHVEWKTVRDWLESSGQVERAWALDIHRWGSEIEMWIDGAGLVKQMRVLKRSQPEDGGTSILWTRLVEPFGSATFGSGSFPAADLTIRFSIPGGKLTIEEPTLSDTFVFDKSLLGGTPTPSPSSR